MIPQIFPFLRDIKCKDAIVSLYDLVGNLEIKQTGNVSYPGLPNRTTGRLDFIKNSSTVPYKLPPSPLNSFLMLPHALMRMFRTTFTDCVLYAVGKPVYHKFTEQNYGAWLKDAAPRNDAVEKKIWATRENDTIRLYEFANKTTYRNNVATKTYRLDKPFRVSIHLNMYNGAYRDGTQNRRAVFEHTGITGITDMNIN